MLTLLVIAIILMILCTAAVCGMIILRGVNLSVNLNYNYPPVPEATVTEIKDVDHEAERSIVSAAQAIQRFFLDDGQIDIQKENRND